MKREHVLFSGRSLLTFFAAVILTAGLVSCDGGGITFNGGGGSGGGSTAPPQGTASTTLSDPPSCRATYDSVFVTVRSVQAHISGTADDSSSGWQELAPDLANMPVQLDLLSTPAGGCTLATLGSNITLPAGDYQQIRLILTANNPPQGQAVPANNACASVNAFNCVVLANNGGIFPLDLSSQANTGLKIPPGQIVGGPIRVGDGQHVDINIDFNACGSIVVQPNNRFRLRPTLTAGQVSSISSGVSGQVVDSATMMPLAGGEVQVAMEQPDSDGIDRIIMQAAADASGNFSFCPVPMGTYDVVAVGQDGGGVTYGPTILTDVMPGSVIGMIPVVAQPMGSTAPGTLQGLVTSENAGAGVSIDAVVSAFQQISVGTGMRQVTIPLLSMSVGNVATTGMPIAMVTCPMNTFCEQYSLIVPAQNPSVAAFMSGGTMFSVPAMPPVPYTVEVRSFAPMSGGTPSCAMPKQSVTVDDMDQAIDLMPGATLPVKQIDFTGCM